MVVIESSLSVQILLDLTYEDASEGDGVVRDRAYCGWQSYQSPITILDSESYPTNIYTHVSLLILLQLCYYDDVLYGL